MTADVQPPLLRDPDQGSIGHRKYTVPHSARWPSRTSRPATHRDDGRMRFPNSVPMDKCQHFGCLALRHGTPVTASASLRRHDHSKQNPLSAKSLRTSGARQPATWRTPTPNTPTATKIDATCLCGASAAFRCHTSAEAEQRRTMSLMRRQRGGCSRGPFRCSSAPSAEWLPLDLGAWVALRLCQCPVFEVGQERESECSNQSSSPSRKHEKGAGQGNPDQRQNAFAPNFERADIGADILHGQAP